jgi:cytochrome c-type biogenesis protein CcmF
MARTWAWPAGVSLLVGGILLALGAGSSIPGLIAYTFSAFVIVSIVVEFVRGTRARKAVAGGSWPSAFSELVARNRRRYGGYVVHAAIVLLAIGIAGSSAYDTTHEGKLRPGQSMGIRGYTLTYRRLVEKRAENAREIRALVDVRRDGKPDGTLSAGKNHYPVEGQISNEVDIRSNLITGEDLYLIAQQIDTNGTVFFKAEVLPLVNLIWLAGFIFIGGTLIALWPDAREARRLADRYGYAAARA